MKAKRILSLLLALVMVFALLAVVGCGEEDPKNTKGSGIDNTAEAEDANSKYDAEVKDLKGHTFYFLSRTTTHKHLDTNEVYAEELNGDKINDAVFKRNTTLEQTYNCHIQETRETDVLAAVKEPLIAGEYCYDFIYAGSTNLRNLAGSNLLVDLNTLENLHLEKTWYDQNLRKGLTIAQKLFYINGDAGTMDDRSTWIMFFNRDFVEKFKLENPYDLVAKGEWTVDKMYEMSEAMVQDKDGDNVMTIGKDVFAYLGEDNNNWYHVAACDCRLSSFTENGDVYIPATVNDDVLDAWAKLKPLLTSPNRDVSDSGSRFRKNLAGFYGINCGALLNFEETTINFGVIPFPKKNVEQTEYWTSISAGWCSCYAIPVVADGNEEAAAAGFASGREMAAYFLEAFSYYSVDTLTPAFYDQVLKRQMIRDTESSEMLDLALKNKVYDPVVLYNFGSIGSIFKSCGSNGSGGTGGTPNAVGTDVNYDNLVSTYEARLDAARKALNNYLNYIDQEA